MPGESPLAGLAGRGDRDHARPAVVGGFVTIRLSPEQIALARTANVPGNYRAAFELARIITDNVDASAGVEPTVNRTVGFGNDFPPDNHGPTPADARGIGATPDRGFAGRPESIL